MKKNISLAVKGYKIFFSSTTLTLNSKPIAGLKINRKPVVGLTTKNCQLFSGRGTTDMKTFFLTLTFALTTMLTFAQSTSQPPIQNISTDSSVVYRLFATNNTYNFIKLNTRNGQMWQVQWSLKDNQFETKLSDVSQVTKAEEKNGRFFLYPTTNTYNFILLDQIDGRAWQVQWNFEAEKRMVVRIY